MVTGNLSFNLHNSRMKPSFLPGVNFTRVYCNAFHVRFIHWVSDFCIICVNNRRLCGLLGAPFLLRIFLIYYRGNNFFSLPVCFPGDVTSITLLHSERPKLHTILVFLIAVGLKKSQYFKSRICFYGSKFFPLTVYQY